MNSLQLNSKSKLPPSQTIKADSTPAQLHTESNADILKLHGMSDSASNSCVLNNNMDHYVEIILATKENTRDVGWMISDDCNAIEEQISIPFYETVTEGSNFKYADWKDQPVVRQAKIKWRPDNTISWMERHLEMTQGFIVVGKAPCLLILGEPTHDREDLNEDERRLPDISKIRGYIVPAGYGIIIKKGTWHDFPVSVGPEATVFVINTKEVVEALASMKEPSPMDFGDCYKVRTADVFKHIRLKFPDLRPIANSFCSLNTSDVTTMPRADSEVSAVPSLYGKGMKRVEVEKWGGSRADCVWVVPIINVEHFDSRVFGPSVQPHLNKYHPEIANRGWRDYGNKRGLDRISKMFKNHGIRCTAVVSSDLVYDNELMSKLRDLKTDEEWEIGAHGLNNSSKRHGFQTYSEETQAVEDCIQLLGGAFDNDKPKTWLSPGFSVSTSTSDILLDAGIENILDFVDDDVPFRLIKDNGDGKNGEDFPPSVLCLPYSMETNDFSLVLTRHLSPKDYASALESHIEQLAKESRESEEPIVVCLGLHTFVSGTPAAVNELGKMLTRLENVSNIVWATAQEVSGCVKAQEPPQKIVYPPTESIWIDGDFPLNSLLRDRSKVALLLIDFQNDFLQIGGFGEKLGNDVTSLRRVIAPTKSVLSHARSVGVRVIHTREGHRPNLMDLTPLKGEHCNGIGKEGLHGRLMVRSEWGNDIVPELMPATDGSECVIDKPGKSAFFQTDLEFILRNTNIDTLIVCGVTTEICVHSTVRDATDRGFKCIVLDDCTASYFDEFHSVGLNMISSQDGIFGVVADSKAIIDCL
mmetsp:Transcript_23074/g.48755  ORF Transcript_23074/g.48755 Transcript_23074/m.48755 type:complete len:812 (+) Transcript_23074:2048-4483(+)